MQINVQVKGLSELKLRLAGLERKIKAVTRAALNDAAKAAKDKTEATMRSVFDRPTPWISRSVRYTKATAEKLEATVDFENWGNKYGVTASQVLRAEIFGGRRHLKRHEVTLRRVGILPEGYAVVPGAGARIDAYGNMSAGQIRQIQSYFGAAQMTSGHTANSTRKTRDKLARGSKKKGTAGFEYFVVPIGGVRTFVRANGKTGTHKMQPGIYQRFFLGHGTAIKPVMIFVPVPSYKIRLPFYEIALREAERVFQSSFDRYATQMLTERGL